MGPQQNMTFAAAQGGEYQGFAGLVSQRGERNLRGLEQARRDQAVAGKGVALGAGAIKLVAGPGNISAILHGLENIPGRGGRNFQGGGDLAEGDALPPVRLLYNTNTGVTAMRLRL